MNSDARLFSALTRSWEPMASLSLVECDFPWGNPDLAYYGDSFKPWSLEECREMLSTLGREFSKEPITLVVELRLSYLSV